MVAWSWVLPLAVCAKPAGGAEEERQPRMVTRRPLEELLATDTPPWPLLRGWVAAAKNQVQVLPAGPDAGSDLHALQVTARSTLGAVVHETGGLLVDHGWVRLLGSRGEGGPFPRRAGDGDDPDRGAGGAGPRTLRNLRARSRHYPSRLASQIA